MELNCISFYTWCTRIFLKRKKLKNWLTFRPCFSFLSACFCFLRSALRSARRSFSCFRRSFLACFFLSFLARINSINGVDIGFLRSSSRWAASTKYWSTLICSTGASSSSYFEKNFIKKTKLVGLLRLIQYLILNKISIRIRLTLNLYLNWALHFFMLSLFV